MKIFLGSIILMKKDLKRLLLLLVQSNIRYFLLQLRDSAYCIQLIGAATLASITVK